MERKNEEMNQGSCLENYHQLLKELNTKCIGNFQQRLDYIKEHKSSKEYLFFALSELESTLLINYPQINQPISLTKDQWDGLLRSFALAIEYMDTETPNVMLDYMQKKVEDGFNGLVEEYKKQGISKMKF